MTSSGAKRSPENLQPAIPDPVTVEEPLEDDVSQPAERERTVARLRLIWEHRGVLARVTGIGLLLAILAAFVIPPRYASTVRLMPPDQQSSMGAALFSALAGKATGADVGGGLGALAGNLLGARNSADLFIGVLHSRTVQDHLIQKFNLRAEYWDRRWEDARKDLERRTDISQDRKSGIITIRVDDRNRQQATAMAQEYVAELNEVVNKLSTSSAKRERVFLEERLAQVKQDLEASEKDFSEFASKNTAIDIKEQAKAMVGAAATLQGHLIAAESELEGLRQIYTGNNVRVKATVARVAELRHQLEKLGGTADAAPTDSANGSESLYPTIRKLPLLGVPYADLYRRTKVDEAVFEVLTQEYELAKVEEAKDIPSVKVLDPADVPERRSFPPRLMIILLGTLLSCVLCNLWVMGSVKWTETDPNDPGKILAREVFDTVRTSLPGASRNGVGAANRSNGFWLRFGKREEASRADSGEVHSNKGGGE